MTFRFNIPARDPVDVAIETLVIAGWTGRDPDAVQHHIDELAELGVAPPSTTPLYYRGGAELLIQAKAIQVVGTHTSGEAEAVVFTTGGQRYVALGSDHTDREAEAISVAVSKQLCPKPMSREAWSLDEVLPHWDDLILRSWAWIDGARVPYQEGTLAGMLPVSTLIDGHGGLPDGTAMFCGTLPAIGGVRPATRFEMALEDPVLGRALSHAYDIETLPVVS